MGSRISNKPIVFVFGAKKGDADGRKKNLSAINTQVAYRAHERRREKNLKSRQRAQAKELELEQEHERERQNVGVEQSTSASRNSDSPTSSTKVEADINHTRFSSQQIFQYNAQAELQHSSRRTSQTSVSTTALTTASFQLQPSRTNTTARLLGARRESDIASDSSSDRDTVNNDTWSASPSSARHSTPATDLGSSSPIAPVSIHGHLNSALDPFFKLPAVASDREKWLVHFYFREMGHVGFGTHSNSLFCPDRDWVSQYVSSKSLCFQWILILAEEHLGRLGVLADETNTIERKAKAYGSMNLVLRGQAVNRDEGISGIMYAAIVDTARTSMHLMALDRLINETGGFEAFLEGPLGIAHPEHVATVYAFGRCPIPNLNDLETIKAHFLSIIRNLYEGARHEQEEKRRIRNRRPWDTLGHQVLDGNGVLVPANHDEHFRYYIKAQQDCFASQHIAQLLNSALDTNGDYASQARHLATLVQTLLILREFDESYLARAMFLKRLKYVAEMSSAIDPTTSRPLLSHGGLLLINSFVRQEVQTYFDRTKALAKGVLISRILVDFLKIFGLLQQQARSMIVSWLRSWLCYNDQLEDVEFLHLQDTDLRIISVGITNAWFSVRGMNSTQAS